MSNQEHKRERSNTQPLVQIVSHMDELLTHHHGSNKYDEEASHDGLPLRQSAEKGLQLRPIWNRGLRWRKRSSRLLFESFSIYRIFQRWIPIRRSLEGPTSLHSVPLGGHTWACGPLRHLSAASRSFLGLFFFINFQRNCTLIDIDFLKKQKTQSHCVQPGWTAAQLSLARARSARSR